MFDNSSLHADDGCCTLRVSTDYITALYPYKASPDLPFDPDPRQELDMEEVRAPGRCSSLNPLLQGEKFVLLHLRPEDGWCLVYKLSNDGRPFKEGWVPGNFMSRWCLAAACGCILTMVSSAGMEANR